MIKTENLPQNLVTGNGYVRKTMLDGIDEIQKLTIAPNTGIATHGHNDQWEIWIWPVAMTAYVCPKGETHEMKNNRDKVMSLIAVKGHSDHNYEELESFCLQMGLFVQHGSLVVEEDTP